MIAWIRSLFCRVEWHDAQLTGFDGLSFVGRCRHCKARLLQDSHGGWFRASVQYADPVNR